jgi:hypothetical protein
MRIALVIMLLAASAFAQDQSAVAKAACGPSDTDFEIKLDKSKHALTRPEPGKAQVYFIQDIGRVSCLGACAKAKVGVDGLRKGSRPASLECGSRKKLLLSHAPLWR